jgi:hypothetical protein
MDEPKKHHYLPVFYLKQWTGADNLLCQYSRPFGEVKAQRKHPSGTGYEPELYTMAGVPGESARAVETRFMRETDNLAAQALQTLMSGNPTTMSLEIKSGWTRFIRSLSLRHPDFVAFLKKEVRLNGLKRMEQEGVSYDQWRRPHEPASLEEYRAAMESSPMEASEAVGLQQLIDHPKVGSFLNSMKWLVLELRRPKHALLTSDRPVITSNGLAYEDSFLMLPIAPRYVFVAVNTIETELRIKKLRDEASLPALINNAIVSQAQKHVYGQNDCQLRFIENRLVMTGARAASNMTWTLS